MTEHHHLEPGISVAERRDRVLAMIEAAGYTVVTGDHETRSMSNPLTRRITLRRGVLVTGKSLTLVALLAHEGWHADQQSGPLPRRLWWAMKYAGFGVLGVLCVPAAALLAFAVSAWFAALAPVGVALVWWSDRFRGDVEVEARGHECAVRMLHLHGIDPLVRDHKFGGLRMPYLLFGSADDFTARCERMGRHLAGLPL